MKKLFLFLTVSLAAGSLFAAVSNCQTRVDKHPDASTADRVKYCLTEEPQQADQTAATEVVLSDVYSVLYPKAKTKKAKKEQEVTKVYKTRPVSTEYLDQNHYPAFRNDIMPTLSEEDAHAAALEAINSDKKAKKQKKAASKPARTLKASPKKEPKAEKQNPQTPEAQIQQAQALQNDPLYQDNTANGAAPAGFLDGGVMGPGDFGYNATDPAFQP